MARLYVLAAAVMFGTTGTAQALGPEASPLSVGAVRIVIGGGLLWLIATRVRRARSTPSGDSATVPVAQSPLGRWPVWPVLVSGVAVAVYQLSFFASVDLTGVAVGTVVALGSAPALSGLLARVVHGAPLTGRWIVCTALAVAGVVLLVAGGEAATVDVRGVALALAAGLGYAIYTVLAKGMLDDGHAPEEVMARAFGTGALLLAPVPVFTGVEFLGSLDGWLTVLYLGAVPTALAYVLFARGLRSLSAGETATLTLAEPLTAAALGALVLGERPGLLAIAGAGLVLCGLIALAAPRRRGPHVQTAAGAQA